MKILEVLLMKKYLAFILAAVTLCSVFSGCSKEKEVEFSGLPQGDPVIEEEEEEYNPDDIIDRTDYNVLDYYTDECSYIKPQKIERLVGERQKNEAIFDRIYFDGFSLDVDYALINSVDYNIYKDDSFLTIERKDGAMKYRITKISSESSNAFWNPEDEATIAKKSEFEELKSKYTRLYSIACSDCYEHTGEPYYDDTPLGGYYTYTPMVDWILKNGFQYEISMYSDKQVKDVLSLAFDIPDSFYYSPSAQSANRSFGLSGCYRSKEDAANDGYQYYLMYDGSGIYAVENYFSYNEFFTNEDYMRFLTPSHTDADLYNTNKTYEYVLMENVSAPSLSKT